MVMVCFVCMVFCVVFVFLVFGVLELYGLVLWVLDLGVALVQVWIVFSGDYVRC